MTKKVINLLLFFLFNACVNKPPNSSNIDSKGYFEDLSFLRENPENNNIKVNDNLNKKFTPSLFSDELERIISLEENQNIEKYLNGYSIQIFSGIERNIADSIFHRVDSIYSEYETFSLYDQPNYRVKVGKFYYKITAHRALENLKRYFIEAIIVPERIKLN